MAKKRTVGPTTSIYGQRLAEEPEALQPKTTLPPGTPKPSELPFERLMRGAHKVGEAVYGVMQKLNRTGNAMSPTTKHDK